MRARGCLSLLWWRTGGRKETRGRWRRYGREREPSEEEMDQGREMDRARGARVRLRVRGLGGLGAGPVERRGSAGP